MSVSRPASIKARASIARIVLAVALLFVVLAAAVPPGSFASSHECGMACCAGKPSHMAGSCSTALGSDDGDAHAAHGPSHHHSTHHSSTKESRRAKHFTSRALTKPCSPECAAAAYSSSQVRRPRHAASVVVKAQPRPHTIRSFVQHSAALTPKSADHTRQARPRAPPALLINLSA